MPHRFGRIVRISAGKAGGHDRARGWSGRAGGSKQAPSPELHNHARDFCVMTFVPLEFFFFAVGSFLVCGIPFCLEGGILVCELRLGALSSAAAWKDTLLSVRVAGLLPGILVIRCGIGLKACDPFMRRWLGPAHCRGEPSKGWAAPHC